MAVNLSTFVIAERGMYLPITWSTIEILLVASTEHTTHNILRTRQIWHLSHLKIPEVIKLKLFSRVLPPNLCGSLSSTFLLLLSLPHPQVLFSSAFKTHRPCHPQERAVKLTTEVSARKHHTQILVNMFRFKLILE